MAAWDGPASAPAPSGADRAGSGRLGAAAAWISAVCCLPYLTLKVVWALGISVGIDDRSVLDESGWAAGNAVMALVQLVGLLLVLALTRSWARRVPAWLLLFPAWLGTGLLFQVAVGASLMAVSSASPGNTSATDLGGIHPWVYVMVYAAFAGQGIALAIAFAWHVRTRWGWLFVRRAGEVIADRSTRLRTGRAQLRTASAEALAGMSVAVAVVCGYWAAGGEIGLSDTRVDESWAMHASRGVGGVVAAAGLLGLAGRWGRHSRLWLPVALTWLGSGSLAAFDGLNLMLNQLLAGMGADASELGWGLTDAVLTVKVAIGILTGAVGLAIVASAFRTSSSASGPRRSVLSTNAPAERVPQPSVRRAS